MGAIHSSNSRTRSFAGCPNRTGTASTIAGGPESLQCSWGGDETGSKEEQPGAQIEQLREGVDKNLVENLDNREALLVEGETGAALNAMTVEPKDDRAGEIK